MSRTWPKAGLSTCSLRQGQDKRGLTVLSTGLRGGWGMLGSQEPPAAPAVAQPLRSAFRDAPTVAGIGVSPISAIAAHDVHLA